MHGPVATNILNLYSATLAALSLDVKAARWKVATVVTIVGTIALIAFIRSDNFAHDFDNWLVSIVVWIAAWGGVMLVDYFIVRRGEINVEALYDEPAVARYGDINWAAIIALIVGLIAELVMGVRARRVHAGPGCEGDEQHRPLVARRVRGLGRSTTSSGRSS